MIEIEFRNVTKRFAQRGGGEPLVAVRDLNFTVNCGEIVSIIGPSGCGKSTILNMGSGLYLPSEGEVFVGGERVTKPMRQVSFMLQKDLLMPWRTIRQNVELGLEIHGMAAEERCRIAEDWLERCHLKGFGDHYPYQLSGGMRQRGALARTMATDPSVLLMDEPFSALDAQTKMVLQEDLAQTLYEQKKTAVFITHDLAEGVILSDRLLVMSHRPGTLIEEIKLDLPYRNEPFKRRSLPDIAPLVAHLMKLLKMDDQRDHLH